jgi:16S rRNA pseudouridine516 synthase
LSPSHEGEPPLRLDAFVARACPATRSEARTWIRQGRVTLGARTERDPSARVLGEPVHLDGRLLVRPPARWTLLLHKPLGCACSHDPGEAPLVYDLLPPAARAARVEAAGRLDRDTSGLLVLSNEGALIQRLTHPRSHVWKLYRAEYAGSLDPSARELCAAGLPLPGEETRALPARLRILEAGPQGGRLEIELREGRHHQVRRMVAALGGEVTRLVRMAIGGLSLPADLPPGAVRTARAEEIEELFRQEPSGRV